MELEKIEKLIEKYLDAETSIKEEAELRAYFNSGNVAAHLEEYKPLFVYFQASKEVGYVEKTKLAPEKKKVYAWVGIAASIILAAGIFLQEPVKNTGFGSYEDPELAMQKTREALDMVSQLMNSGKEDLLYIKEFNTTKNSFLKQPK